MEVTFPLCTDRLLLRDFVPVDVERVQAFAGDPEVTRFTHWGPNSIADSEAFVRAAAGQARDPARQAFDLAAVTRADDVLIGSAAIRVEDPAHRRGEIGMVFHRSAWGKGYATEALRALIRFGFDELGLRRIAATCHPDNLASAGALVKAGLRPEGRLRGHLQTRTGPRDSLLFAILPTDLPPP